MASKGLDETGRERVYALARRTKSGEEVRKLIDKNVMSEGKYDRGKNLELITWLRDRDFGETADHLADYLG